MLVHLQAQENLSAYRLGSIAFDEALVEDLSNTRLPKNWRQDPAPAFLQTIGDNWVAQGNSVILRLPSVLIGRESNYLLNPLHPDFSSCFPGKLKPFRSDGRLVIKLIDIWRRLKWMPLSFVKSGGGNAILNEP